MVEYFGNIKLSDEWEWTKLEKAVHSYDGSYGEDTPSENRIEVIVLGVGNVTNDGRVRLSKSEKRYLNKNEETAILFEDDLFVVKSSGSSANIRSGKTAICPPELSGKIACSNFLFRLVPDKTKVDPKYLWVLLNSQFSKEFVRQIAGSTTYPNIKWKTFKDFYFPNPKTNTLRKSVADTLVNKIEHIEIMRQAALMQKEAVEALQGALLREVFPFNEGDELPNGWKWEKLDKIFQEVKNQVQPYEDEFKTLPFVGLENVVSHTREYTDEEYNPPASTCFKFDETNILYGKLRPYLNKVYLPTGKGKSSMELIPLKTKNNYNREFLAAVLQSEAVIGDTVKFSTGGRMPRADLKKLKKLEVAIPSDVSICNDLGISVSKKIKEFIDLNKKSLTQLEAIEALPAAILREVFKFYNN